MSRNVIRSGVIVVMPCLNEAATLREACLSLGFGDGSGSTSGHHLLIVDNGSNDESLEIAAAIIRFSIPGTVSLVHEPERGHVPARASGVRAAELQLQTEFIVQADADTIYGPDYLDVLWSAGKQHGPGVLIDTEMRFPRDFVNRNTELLDRLQQFDATVPVSTAQDVIVDDKGCGYWLCDYKSWGGHIREFWSTGEEMLAETTRLFIRARLDGARRALAVAANAQHSARNWERNGALEIASAGFPMPRSWQRGWYEPITPERPVSALTLREEERALQRRGKMIRAIFEELPTAVEASRVEQETPGTAKPSAAALIEESFRAAGATE